jgi:hypothetical protein
MQRAAIPHRIFMSPALSHLRFPKVVVMKHMHPAHGALRTTLAVGRKRQPGDAFAVAVGLIIALVAAGLVAVLWNGPATDCASLTSDRDRLNCYDSHAVPAQPAKGAQSPRLE